MFLRFRGNVFTEQLPSNGCCSQNHRSAAGVYACARGTKNACGNSVYSDIDYTFPVLLFGNVTPFDASRPLSLFKRSELTSYEPYMDRISRNK
jgi:hypothetical protein